MVKPSQQHDGGTVSDILVSYARRAKFGERNASRKLAMIALCNAANDAGEAITMAAEEIAEAAELLSSKNAMRVRRELIGVGLVSAADDNAGRGRGAKGLYRINVERLEALFNGEWDYAAAALEWRASRSTKGAVTAPNERVPSQHPNDNDKGAALGAAKGAALGAAKGAALGAVAPHTPSSEVKVSNNNSLPLTPSAEEGERAREVGFEQVLQELRTAHPQHLAVIDRLIDPLLRQRKLNGCPDPVFALGEIVKTAANHDDGVLGDAVARVKAARGYSFKVSDVETALKAAVAASKAPGAAEPEPASPATARLHEALHMRLGAEIFDAWFARMRVETTTGGVVVSVSERFLKTYIEQTFDGALRDCAKAVFGTHAVKVIVRQPEKVHA